MAKIITENFKVETTNELFNSFKNQNDALSASFETELTALNSSTFSNALNSGNIVEIKTLVENQLEKLRPEAEYYIFASRSISSIDGVPVIRNTQKDKRDFERKVVFGNKVDNNSARYMFYENSWTPNTVYDAFDDTKDISISNSFVTVRGADDDYIVFKCIENNNNSPSTTSPQSVIAQLASSGYQSVETSDKYIWHYMFTVVASEANIYKTSNSLPLPTNGGDANVIANAKECISQIIIEQTPANHFNQFVFDTGINSSRVTVQTQANLGQGRRSVTLGVQNNTVLSNINDFYKDMYLRASAGANAGKLFDIINTTSNSGTSEIIVTVESVDDLPVQCELVPKVIITSPELGGTRARAYGIINRFGTLERVAYETKGTNYKFATAMIMNPRGLTDTSTTNLRVVVSPTGGHGSNPINELSMSRIAIVTNFVGESTTIPKSNFYTQVGLVKNPKFSKITGSGPYSTSKISPDSFDNRTFATVSGNQTSIAVAGHYVQQFVETVDVVDKESGRKYVITELGNLSVAEWESMMGVTAADKVDGQIVIGLTFTANSATVDSSKTGKISSAVDGADPDKDIEVVKGIIHESTYTSTTKIAIAHDTGDHRNNFLPGKIEIKTTELAQSGNTLTINTFNDIEYGAYVSYSGELLHFIDFSPIERKSTTKEKIKFLFDF